MQETLFGVELQKEKTEEEIKEEKKQAELEVTDLNIKKESDYIATLNPEGLCFGEGFNEIDIFKTIFEARKVFNKKTKKEKFMLDRFFFYKGLEKELLPICDNIEFKSEEELTSFLDDEIKFNAFLREQNKKHIYWDTRRYFWKKEGEDFKQVIPMLPEIPINHLEQKISELSNELKEYLKKKYGYPVTIRVLKGDENAIMSDG